ncbi:DEAD/DEAH box helicase [Candidatus Daviesbacteria bacterium]|nr:DEAD/DEAH box helicase [Candidatus Daviesbacteria bacterium]
MISISYEKPNFILSFPYNEEDLRLVRSLSVREWDKKQKVWKVYHLAIKSLEELNNTVWSKEALVAKETINRILSKCIDFQFKKGEARGFLRPYQSAGISYLAFVNRGFLNDEMGLGKTVQVIQTLLDLDCRKSLILCSATLKRNWENEFLKHFNIQPLVITGNAEERKELWNSDNKFLIANYDLLNRDWGIIPKKWDAIICDEVMHLKNHAATRTKLAKKLISKVRIPLSGTLFEKNIFEFHSVLDWAIPGLLPPFYRYKYRYCVFDFNGKVIDYKKDKLTELYTLTAPFILRRTKDKVLTELPPKIYNYVPLDLDEMQKEAYKAIASEFIEWLRKQTGTNWGLNALQKRIKLRQFVEFADIINLKVPNPKLDWLDEMYEATNKMVVFSFFDESIKRLQKHFNTKYYISGSVDADKRVGIIDEFNAEEKAILVSTDAGKYGVNITGADTIVHFGSVDNPATMMQREDRLHRFGQKSIVNVYNPYYVGTIDEGMMKKWQKERDNLKEFEEGTELMAKVNLSRTDFERMIYGN